jgi:hypothetical protein
MRVVSPDELNEHLRTVNRRTHDNWRAGVPVASAMPLSGSRVSLRSISFAPSTWSAS